MAKNILIVHILASIVLFSLMPQHSQATQSDVPKEPLTTRFAYRETNKEVPYDSLEQGEEFPDVPLTQESKFTEIGKFSEGRQNDNSGIKVNLLAHMGDINAESILEDVYKAILTQRLHKKNIEQTEYYQQSVDDLHLGYFTQKKNLLNDINIDNKSQYGKSNPKPNKPRSKSKKTNKK